MSKCIVCGNSDLRELISFDKYPLCIGVLPPQLSGKVGSYPLSIGECSACSHIQQMEILADKYKGVLYKDEYSELLSSVPTPSKTGVGQVEAQMSFDFFINCNLPKGKVLEIGCYDGYFLSLLKKKGYEVQGIEPNPASDIAKEEYGIPVIKDFFSEKYFKRNTIDIIILRNILEHMPEADDFLEGVCSVLKPSGYMFIEVPNVHFSLRKGAIGSFFHQHVSYFSLDVLLYLLSKHSLKHIKSDEGYFIYLCVKKVTGVNERAFTKKKRDNATDSDIKRYFSLYNKRKLELSKILEKENNVAIFGAGGYTTGLIHMLGERLAKKIKYVYDNSKLKHGNLLAELPVTVRDPECMKADRPNILIVCTSLHQEAIVKQAKKMNIDNLKIVVLFPTVRIVH